MTYSLGVPTYMGMGMIQSMYYSGICFEMQVLIGGKSAGGRNSQVWKILCDTSVLGTSKRLATGSPDPYPD